MGRWPSIRPLINQEAVQVARTLCRRYKNVNIQPGLLRSHGYLEGNTRILLNTEFDLVQVDASTDSMLENVQGLPWLAHVRRLAISKTGVRFAPFESLLQLVDSLPHLKELSVLVPLEDPNLPAQGTRSTLPLDEFGFHQFEVAGDMDVRAFSEKAEVSGGIMVPS
ncbi:Uu.00g139020.m01.CDS01 [Anthostomella pinea]|uniref:Uu.00g139020.m01.CDS01 n=1 Tax=Anthostomella pinea TaxID=933095 RepID=A0AAI8VPR9_9PEZI|nr:Uu.00g139020.m01.CDS01 [Anthostomella pinea]